MIVLALHVIFSDLMDKGKIDLNFDLSIDIYNKDIKIKENSKNLNKEKIKNENNSIKAKINLNSNINMGNSLTNKTKELEEEIVNTVNLIDLSYAGGIDGVEITYKIID